MLSSIQWCMIMNIMTLAMQQMDAHHNNVWLDLLPKKMILLVGDHAQLPPVCTCLGRRKPQDTDDAPPPIRACSTCHLVCHPDWTDSFKHHHLKISQRHVSPPPQPHPLHLLPPPQVPLLPLPSPEMPPPLVPAGQGPRLRPLPRQGAHPTAVPKGGGRHHEPIYLGFKTLNPKPTNPKP